VRHPIIERITTKEYIPNDVKLCGDGILLYGVNSTGKSSLTKSIGLAIIMAQAGMYVAGKLKFKPYNNIITRLSGNDDIFKGHSSFIIEVLELRTILRNANNNTLVLGDELCRGTESISGTSLTVATIQTLIERKTSFIFSTHMHHLAEMKEIQDISDKLQILHLSTRYDESLGELIYDRKLSEGPGSSIYGLEVCKSLSLPKDFIDKANSIRKHLNNIPSLILDTRRSRYNGLVYIDKCSICGSNIDLHTHHIKEQNNADSKGFINHYHKNSEFNLLILCKQCHIKLHTSNIHLEPSQTLNGVYLTMLES
jgi:DNA mismatch repair protein MutS